MARLPITGRAKPRTIKPSRSRKLIREFHRLLRQKEDHNSTPENRKQATERIEALGGLGVYQVASLAGQSLARGGDTSKVLKTWLGGPHKLMNRTVRMLEIGSLNAKNAISTSGLVHAVQRIDLNPQDPGILRQDFMLRPVPASSPENQFEVLSLSLVINYVPTPKGRGEMLVRTTRFLVEGGLLFFVLPEPCISNSRYLTFEKMEDIFKDIGYKVLECKTTQKLIYWLLQLAEPIKSGASHKKRIIKDGPGRNNFSIVIEHD